ncbi:HD domain-containing protein [Desulfonema magnum]|uniref:HD domain-containing protein n=1 Tax=Desulfonema magnum TaxID=45655 RepID=A0A975BLH3_9BACT|nr:HD domain-containing protein [Desulfonema magnum]QTA87608.1 HD domain-containing protein [Desulfonema magnum]
MTNPIDIISEFYKPGSKAYEILVQHSEHVAQKALDAAAKVSHLNPDLKFIEEAAMLHDIGIFMTNAPGLGCTGQHPYICHGFLGRVILEKKGLPKHALVCERHVGVGITVKDIKARHLPLPVYDMVPISTEEQIVCYADKFFSKNRDSVASEKSVDDIKRELEPFGQDKITKFQSWRELFG